MEKQILVAVDNSRQSLETIDYAAQMTATIAPVAYTLVHIQPALSQYLADEAHRKHSARIALEKVMAQNEEKANQTLETAARRMAAGGVDQDRIRRLTLPRNTAVADDLLALGTAKSCDAILVGRRGASYMRQWLMGSVTANLVEHSDVIPIWVVDGTVTSDKILLAADGSQSTLRALDHIAYMLSDQPAPALHLLHVRPRLQDFCEIELTDDSLQAAENVLRDEDQHCMTDFYSQAMAVLQKNGIDKERVSFVTVDGKLTVTRSILGYARGNGIATVAMGRRGRSGSTFFGSTSRGLLQKAEDMALWVVP
ncbi:MAG: universal stress protein [Desulfobacteraceae bacterium]|jgi:nucleotide-binding universal stress UspA family protein